MLSILGFMLMVSAVMIFVIFLLVDDVSFKKKIQAFVLLEICALLLAVGVYIFNMGIS